MDRKEFLKTCAGGLCACTAACFAAPSEAVAAEAANDWRVPFVKERYAKLLNVLLDKMGEEELTATLHEVGGYCASTFGDALKKYRGDVKGFAEFIKNDGSGDLPIYDRERNVIIATSRERTDCICPLIGIAAKTPTVVCNCSIGWHQYAWQTLLQKKVKVELKESVLRGGRRCTLEVRILDEPV
jgi:predicted ArsR family transcriptional regulator